MSLCSSIYVKNAHIVQCQFNLLFSYRRFFCDAFNGIFIRSILFIVHWQLVFILLFFQTHTHRYQLIDWQQMNQSIRSNVMNASDLKWIEGIAEANNTRNKTQWRKWRSMFSGPFEYILCRKKHYMHASPRTITTKSSVSNHSQFPQSFQQM